MSEKPQPFTHFSIRLSTCSNTSDLQMSGMEIYEVVKSPVRISKVEWRNVICTRRDQGIWMRKEALSVDWDGCGQIGI